MAPSGSEVPEHVRERRAAARSRVRRRRLVGVLAVVLACGALAGVVIALTGREPGRGATPAGASRSSHHSDHDSNGSAANGRHAGWRPDRGPVPILMYHPIQEPVPGADYPDLFVPTDDFTRQMDWLDHHGYEGVTLDQVERAWWRGGDMPPKPVVISFDDGYRSQYVNAYPVLHRLGWPAVLNLIAGEPDMLPDETRAALDGGWELASHTISHLDLTAMDSEQLDHELGGSRRVLERRFHVPVRNFAYPAGRYDATVEAAVRDAGYEAAMSTEPGLARRQDRFALDRIRIELADGLGGFVEKMRAEAGA